MTPDFPTELYNAEGIARLERLAIDEGGITGMELMERAGLEAFRAIQAKRPEARTLSAVTGSGHNGGDAFIVARLAHQMGFDVRVYPVAPLESLKGDALIAYQRFKEAGGETLAFIPEDFEATEILVDGLFGTGLKRAIESPYREVIEAINRYRARGDQQTVRERLVVALDLPSGISADTGEVLGIAVEADLTITFIGLKQGLFTGAAPSFTGEILFDDLKVDPLIRHQTPSSARLLATKISIPRRAKATHKGHYGHVLIIGGDQGTLGAARLAAEASARVGAGLVTIATRMQHAGLMAVMRPELMSHGIEDPKEIGALIERATVIAIGPGLGQSPWAQGLFQHALAGDLPLIIDADALHLLAETPHRRDSWVLSPHPGEAGHLLQCTSKEIQQDRFHAINALQARYGGTIVLKGAGTLIKEDTGLTSLCRLGNPGMATGGMGDVLTGVITGLIAQGIALGEAARLGVHLHARAGDLAAHRGERGLLASDLMPHLRRLVNA